MKILNELLNIDEISFKKHRKTSTGNIIIDFSNEDNYQTCWMEIINDVEHNICVNSEKIKDVLSKIDEKIKNFTKECLDISDEEINTIYVPILKSGKYMVFNINTTTILFEGDDMCGTGSEIKNRLNRGDIVRFIINFKKLNFRQNEIKCIINTVQIEKLL